MNKFEKLDLPVFDLYKELLKLVDSGHIEYDNETDQICLNTVEPQSYNYKLGRGSLIYDWDYSYHKDGKLVVPFRKIPLKENDFKYLCKQFENTAFETVYNALQERYNLGRVRIMISKPKTCLSWHKDNTQRVHFPMKTQEGCFMLINNEVQHLEKHQWYITDTTINHTAINASKEDRLHLVVTLLDK